MNEVIPIPGFADPFSSISHLLGAILFALLSVPLLWRARHDWTCLLSEAVFCVGAVLLLAVSGCYHLVDSEGTARMVLRRLDHAAIFFLIAASFTPVHMILFRGWRRWGVLASVWIYAVVAITLKTIYFDAISPTIGIALYLIMGWIGTATGILLWQARGFAFMLPMLLGGIAYSVGAIMQAMHWPVLLPGVVQWHEAFHVMVLVGLGLHWSFNYSIADGQRVADTGTLKPAPLAA